MMAIAITPPALTDPRAEAARIVSLLDSGGYDRVHLRHPAAPLRDVRSLIEAVPQRLHSRLVLHGHFVLVCEFNLGGLHLNRRCPEPPPRYAGPLSRSCHTVDEVMQSHGYAYVTLSPVFDSISKPGYLAAFPAAELERLTDAPVPVIALGGVTDERLPLLERYNFTGHARIGSLWDNL